MLRHATAHRDIPDQPTSTAAMSAAFQGVEGAFSEEAVRRLWSGSVRAQPAVTFDAALDAVAAGEVMWAVIPIHNSTIGEITLACAALAKRKSCLVRVGEVSVPVRHCLAALPGTTFADVRYVGSHPAALAQCTRLFREHGALTACEAFDTAGAARELAERRRPSPLEPDTWYARLGVANPGQLAVIASERAAERYGLAVLRSDVQDRDDNVTRFVAMRAREQQR
jgi:prephenate dehydratase